MKRILLALAALGLLIPAALVTISVLRPDLAYRGAMSLERSVAGLEEKTIVVDGARWHYLEGGDDGDPTLVLVHGFSADKDNWVRLARHLDGYHFVIPDLIGFGDSDRPLALDYRVRAQADRLVAFLDALGIEQAGFGGNSMGGYIIGAIAGEHPERVGLLWLLAPAGVAASAPSEFFTQVLAGGANPLIPESVEGFDATLSFVFSERPFVPGAVVRYLAERQLERRPILEHVFADLRRETPSLEDYLADFTGPTLVIWGAEDRVLDVSGAATLGQLLPQAEVQVLEGVGHLPMVERPGATAAALRAFQQSRGSE